MIETFEQIKTRLKSEVEAGLLTPEQAAREFDRWMFQDFEAIDKFIKEQNDTI